MLLKKEPVNGCCVCETMTDLTAISVSPDAQYVEKYLTCLLCMWRGAT